ncbi:MAG TPA: response regulator [Rhodobacteraceae bacterium]|jgi:two-component system OmpR family response regulator|nr:response regulator [Paracoccaceae bacterium]MDE2631779.1 response regulator [Paracoccaceae bacterium]HBR61373.1 response regulator [Paracoccaceae bacterium]|tara:strand:+ start:2375 stop:3094 length:720 start_codon:yes stop_codon:yes gene_type:complete
MDDLTQNALPQYLRSDRPLFGLTVLVVEDSKFACEGIRLLCLRSGARIRRADCLRSARRHLQVYRPSVVIIDLGLPDGNGAELIEELNAASPRVGIVLAISGDSFGESVALAAGADGFFAKPLISLAVFQETILSLMPKDYVGKDIVRTVSSETVEPDLIAFQEDMAHAAEVIEKDTAAQQVEYLTLFLRGVARSASDAALLDATERLGAAHAQQRQLTLELACVAGLVQDRLVARTAI